MGGFYIGDLVGWVFNVQSLELYITPEL